MTLLEHLAELRHRLIICVASVLVAGIVMYFLYNQLLGYLLHPYCQLLKHNKGTSPFDQCRLFVNNPIDLLTIRIKVAFFSGVGVSMPVILWQVWRFITPGLHRHEKRYAIPFTLVSLALFVFGGFVALQTFPLALDFFRAVGGSNVGTLFAPDPYLKLIMLLIVAYGIAFEFPVALVALQMVGVVSSTKLRKWRRGAIVGVTLFAAVFTPSSDPISMFAMAVPMYVFYEAAIVVGRLLKK